MNKLLLLADGGGGAWPHERIKQFIPAVREEEEDKEESGSHGVFLSPVLSSLVVPAGGSD